MQVSEETQTTRLRVGAIPRMNIRLIDGEEWWHRKAIVRLSDVEAIIGPMPESDWCERYGLAGWCGDERRPCERCYVAAAWNEEVVDMVRRGTDWDLSGFGTNSARMTGRAFATQPSVYRHVRHPGVVVVSWSGGLDV